MTTGDVTPGQAFMSLLDPDPDRAAEKYVRLFHQLTKFFEWRDCADPEELAEETLTRGFAKIAEGATIYTPHPGAYFYGIAKNVLREERRARRKQPDELMESGVRPPNWRSLTPTEARICLTQCLERVSADERELVLRYYGEDRKTLSKDLGLSMTALRVRVCRIKYRLTTWLQPSSNRDDVENDRK